MNLERNWRLTTIIDKGQSTQAQLFLATVFASLSKAEQLFQLTDSELSNKRLQSTRTRYVLTFNYKLHSTAQPALTRKPSYRWQTRATRKHAKIVPIRRAYNVVADNTGLSSFV